MFSLNGTLKKSGSVRRWETKQFIGMALGVVGKLHLKSGAKRSLKSSVSLISQRNKELLVVSSTQVVF